MTEYQKHYLIKALHKFICRTASNDMASENALRALPEAIKLLTELEKQS